MEEYAVVLDYLPQGRPEDKSYHKSPLLIAIGDEEFKLLELIPKPNAIITIGERLYIGKNMDMRTKIVSVKRRISYKDLTNTAISELPYVLESIVNGRENVYVDFFNRAESINTRMHSLELLPGLGNKTMWSIIEERKKRKFDSFKDLTERIKTLHNPQKMIAQRIIQELQERHEKYKLFVAK